MITTTAQALADWKTIGWFQERMEFGPRALGGRSFLGDARSPEMQKQLNLKVKYSESLRPYAPSVLREDASEWFDIDSDSYYMLMVASIKKDPALITQFKELAGCPIIVSTSFNVRDEPIVCTPEDAFRCFMGTDTELLVIGNVILHKEKQDPALKQDYTQAFELD